MGERGPKPANQLGLTADSIRTGKPVAPRHLTKEADAEWRRVVDVLYENRLLTTLDRALLAEYCETWAMCVKCEQFLDAQDGYSMMTEKGYPVQWPEVGILNRSRKQLSEYCKMLGFAPSVRGRIALPKENEKDDNYGAKEDSAAKKIAAAKARRAEAMKGGGTTIDLRGTGPTRGGSRKKQVGKAKKKKIAKKAGSLPSRG